MRRREMILLTALTLAFGMNGEALAKDAKQKPPKPTDAEKAKMKEANLEKKTEKAENAQNKSGDGAPLMRLHAASGRDAKPDSSWLNHRGRKSIF